MLEAIRENVDILSLGANLAMVLIWLVYLHLFLKSYRRHLRPSIIINRGAGTGLQARCLITNMSAEAIYIEGIILVLERDGEQWRTALSATSEIRKDENATQAPRPNRIQEGPLASGAFMDIGRFQDIVERAFGTVQTESDREDRLGFECFEIWVIARYTAEQQLVFVRSRFDVGRTKGNWALRPHQIENEEIRSGEKRRQMEEVLQHELERGLVPGQAKN